MAKALSSGFFLAALFCTPVLSQESVRKFPPQTERAVMTVMQPPELLLNGRPERLSPGARIRSADNLLILSGQLVGQSMLVNYVRESHGMVHEVWVLNQTEAAQPLPVAQ